MSGLEYYLKKLKHRRLIVGSIVAIAIGSILWAVIGPAIVLIGIPAQRTSEVTPRISGDHKWSFFKAYFWLSGPPSIEMSSTYWLGFAISIIGLSILAAGVIGIILAAVREMRVPASEREFEHRWKPADLAAGRWHRRIKICNVCFLDFG